jgi:Flp pilus assembly pilin Flp
MKWRLMAFRVARLPRREDGQDLLEYAMLAALISIAALTTVSALASVIKTKFWDVVANVL